MLLCHTVLSLLAGSAAIASPFSELAAAADWKILTNKSVDPVGEINIFEKSAEDPPCLRADGKTDLPVSLLLELVSDIEGEPTWSTAGLTEAKILKKGEGYLDYYQYLDTPGWTFAADRFWFLRGTFIEENGQHIFYWDRMGDRGGPYQAEFDAVTAAHPKAVEPPTNLGGWVFVPEGNQVKMTYII
ncbi:MAG: hypothetical protein HN348_05410, partial [Proteobacteria bacterium]|nr:hypothetical protein [Pseudomonadota bacterium]